MKDITAWLLLKMMEPNWFWSSGGKLVKYSPFWEHSLGCYKTWDYIWKTNMYLPIQYLINSKPNIESLVKHFVYCGVRISNANSHLQDFATAYIKANKPPMTPEWSNILKSHPYEHRPSVTQCCKFGAKANDMMPLMSNADEHAHANCNAGSH